jgi:hypothetical protein
MCGHGGTLRPVFYTGVRVIGFFVEAPEQVGFSFGAAARYDDRLLAHRGTL